MNELANKSGPYQKPKLTTNFSLSIYPFFRRPGRPRQDKENEEDGETKEGDGEVGEGGEGDGEPKIGGMLIH